MARPVGPSRRRNRGPLRRGRVPGGDFALSPDAGVRGGSFYPADHGGNRRQPHTGTCARMDDSGESPPEPARDLDVGLLHPPAAPG